MKSFQMKKIIKYFGWNGFFLIVMVYGVMHGNEFAFNLIQFATVLFFLLSFMMYNKGFRDHAVNSSAIGSFIPIWFDSAYDLICIGIFATHGHYLLAAMWFWIMVMTQYGHKTYINEKKLGEANE